MLKEIAIERIEAIDSMLGLLQDELTRLRNLIMYADTPELPWGQNAKRAAGKGKRRG